MYEINDHDLRAGQEEYDTCGGDCGRNRCPACPAPENTAALIPMTIGDILDLIAEPDQLLGLGNRVWRVREGIDLNAQVNIIGHLDSDSTLNAMVSDDDGSLCIMEA